MPSASHRSNGKLEEVGDQAGADFLSIAAHRGVAFGDIDIDNDGRMDAVVTTLRGQVKILATSPTPGITDPDSPHWLAQQPSGNRREYPLDNSRRPHSME